jgi:NAD(P)-dependent dehydrogenase (short-subunit alcohol dehydrogenase family)
MSDEARSKNALVTGGTDGIGKEIARGLARSGHRVGVVGRDAQKGAQVAEEIRQTTGNPNVESFTADLSLMREADRLANDVASRWKGLNYLVHSAGVVCNRHALTEEGFESNFAVNYASRFALTQSLLPLMKGTGQPNVAARIVIISGAARNGTIYFDDVSLKSKFGLLRMIGQFCQANDVFTVEQARRLAANYEHRVTITCLKMGVVKTNIRNGPDFPGWMKVLVPLVMDPLLGQTPEEAAESGLKLLVADEYEGVTGALFLKIKKLKQIVPDASVTEGQIGKRLWELSKRLSASSFRQYQKSISAGQYDRAFIRH